MAKGYFNKNRKDTKIFTQIRDAKRREWAFKDREVMDLAISPAFQKRLISYNEDLDTRNQVIKAQRNNVARLALELQKKDPEKFFYLEQISEALEIDLRDLKSILSGIKEELLNLYGVILRSKYSVGYRVADYNDFLLETHKSFTRIFGTEVSAIKRAYCAKISIENKRQKLKYQPVIKNIHQDYLEKLDQIQKEFNKEVNELILEDDAFADFVRGAESEIAFPGKTTRSGPKRQNPQNRRRNDQPPSFQ